MRALFVELMQRVWWIALVVLGGMFREACCSSREKRTPKGPVARRKASDDSSDSLPSPKPVFSLYPEKLSSNPKLPKMENLSKSKTSKKKSADAEKTEDLSEEAPSRTRSKKKERGASKSSRSRAPKDETDARADVLEEGLVPPAPPAPQTFPLWLIIVIGVVAGVGVLCAAGLVARYLLIRFISERTRRLRYMESLKPAYAKRGDGLDELREVIE